MRTCQRCRCGVSDKKLTLAPVYGRYGETPEWVCKDREKCNKQREFRVRADAHRTKLERLRREMDFHD